MNRHTVFLELAAVGLDFRLTTAEQTRLDGHLATCPACRARVEGFHRDARAIAGLPEARLDPRRAAVVLDAALHGPARSPLPVLRLALVAALIGALAIGAALVGAELLRRMADDDLSVIPPVPTASPDPEASPGVDNGVGTSWTRVDLPDASVRDPGGATMTGVIAGGPGAIAWGWAYGLEPRIWTTTDGITWERAAVEVPTDPDPEYQNPAVINDISQGGPGYVAVGFYYRLGIGHAGLVWTSVDGRTWDLVPDQPDLEHAIVGTVLPWRGELLAFGDESFGPSGGALPAIAWASDDGRTWTRFELDLPEGLTMGGVVAVGDRLWAAPDEIGDDTGMEWTATLITSSDGRTWTLSDLRHQAGSLVSASGVLISLVRPWPADSDTAVPPDARTPGVYQSTDAATWQSLSTDPTAVGYDLAKVGSVLVMVGDDSAGDPQCWAECQAMGWRSLDGGATWQPVPADIVGGTMTSAAALPDGRLVSVGLLLDEQGSPAPAAWVSIPSAAPSASLEPSPVPSQTPAAEAAIGTSWTPATVPDAAEAMDGVIAGGPGAIAWGQVYGEPSRIWTSADGLTWERATVEVPPDTGPGADMPAFITGVAGGDRGYVAVGYGDVLDGRRGLVWTSADGRSWSLLPASPSFESVAIGSVIGWDGGLVAFGVRSFGPDGGEGEQLVWASSDGQDWRSMDLAVPNGLRLGSVVSAGGRLWASASPADGAGVYDRSEWRLVASDDGHTWQTAALPSLGGVMSPTAAGLMALVPPGWVTGGEETGPPDPGVYLAVDDVTWEAVSTDGAPWGSELIEVGSTLVVVGDDADAERQCPDDCHPMSWRSVDRGATWQAVPVDDTLGTIFHVAALPDGTLIGAGMTFGAGGSNAAAVWVSAPAPTGGPSVAPSASGSPATTGIRVDELSAGGRSRFGGADVRVLGWLAPPWGVGGPGTDIQPAWLGEWATEQALWLQPRNPDGCLDDDDCVWTFIHVDPGAGLVLEGPERWVELTGHFDDPAAATCVWGGMNGPWTPEQVLEMCRDAFVATAVRDTAAP